MNYTGVGCTEAAGSAARPASPQAEGNACRSRPWVRTTRAPRRGGMNMLLPVEPINVSDYERLAAERLASAELAYFAGGANDELTLAANLAAYRRWQLRPRVLVDVAAPSTATTVLGQEL